MIVIVLFGVVGITAYPSILSAVVGGYEDVSLTLFPSAPRAYAYGERHFSASYPGMYDVTRAEYFFNKVRQMDPQHPFVYHQLARIAFLKGDFTRAHALVDAQIRYHGSTTPSSYYVRGLIEGYMSRYDDAAKNYEHYLQFDSRNWAALNDYAWVLLKAQRFQDAAVITARGLEDFPDNPWLLNSHATALYEVGEYAAALEVARHALNTASMVTERQWLTAYPGNDPAVAREGIATLQKSITDNVHTMEVEFASNTVQ